MADKDYTNYDKIMEIQGNEKIRELATLALMQDLWLTFYENVKLSDKGDVQTVDEAAQKRVQLIMQYIHETIIAICLWMKLLRI